MEFIVLTIFPEMFDSFFGNGMLKRAIVRNKISASCINIRDFCKGVHRVADDRPYGGGCGMLMKPEPLAAAIRAAKRRVAAAQTVLLSPQGRPFDQRMAFELASGDASSSMTSPPHTESDRQDAGLILICGRYEGIDERIRQELVDEEISIGDYVLTGGELAAMVVIDAVTRLVPGVLGGEESALKDSFTDDLLEHAHYTRPYDFEGRKVPDVLLSGNHREIDQWRREGALIRTCLKRPDLMYKRSFDAEEKAILKKWHLEIEKLIHA
jgi:tRNA (guanine37-N1)-methyltransferase